MKITVVLVLVLASAIAGALVGAIAGLSLGGKSSGTPAAPAPAPLSAELPGVAAHSKSLTPEQLYQREAPAVVVITAARTRRVRSTPFAPALTERVGILGSGFVVDRKGDIVTNDHVVQGDTGIRVGFSSGASYRARVIGADPSTDLAVVRVRAPSSALDPLAFADSAAVEVGDSVYAIGNPFGLDRTMTAGIVSATEREIHAPNGRRIPDAIQTDAPINHGNSGGPLLDKFGRVVGVDDQIESGTVNGNVGVGFAIGGDTARSVAADLIRSGRAEHAWLGVDAETIDPGVAKVVHGLPKHGVTVVRVVRGSPAARAGLHPSNRQITVNGIGARVGGDSIVEIDGKSVETAQELTDLVATRKPGDRLQLSVVRGGKRRTVGVTLGDVPAGHP